MATWTTQRKSGIHDELKERLGYDVFEFIKQDPVLVIYLQDYQIIKDKLQSQMEGVALLDNSMFVLTVCKFFEGALRLIALETGWAEKFNNTKLHSVRNFFLVNRGGIEEEIDAKIAKTQKGQEIKDKVFSVANDFKERHDVLHSGNMLKTSEVANYDAVITKVKEIVSVLIENGFIDIGDIVFTSSTGDVAYQK